MDPTLTRSDLAIAAPSSSTCPAPINSTTRLRDRPSMRATAASTRSPFIPSGTSRTFRSATRYRASIMIIIVIIARVPPSGPGVPLASDANPFHHRQEHDQDGSCGDAHVGDVEDRPVRQLQEVDHVTAQHSGRSEQPIGQVSGDASTQEPDRHSPRWMTDSRNQLDDHEGKHHDPGDRKHVGKTLALAEGSAGVTNEPQRK